jgi:putative endopeptidase
MKKFRKIILIVILLILLAIYLISFNFYGNKELTKVNSPVSTVLETCPRLEDDFYDNINYEYLSTDKLNDEEIADYDTDRTEQIEEEKTLIIDELLSSNNAVGTKIRNLYNSYMENTEENAINELNKYIDKMNDSSNIEEFVNNAIEVNYELSTDILFSPNILYNQKGESNKYFGLDLITYDWDNSIGYYTISDYDAVVRMYKKYDVQILKKYGYSSNEAIEIAEKVQSMYEAISRFSEINQYNLLDNGYKVYSMEELQSSLKNIPLDTLASFYKEFLNGKNEILVVDINQLKQIDDYLKEENLETLKYYATLKILTSYSKYISEDYYKIYYDYMIESQNYDSKRSQYYTPKVEYTKEEIAYSQIYSFFKDTVTEEFANKYFTKEQKEFYTNLIKEEIEVYKSRIENKEWLSDETKEKALAKMEKMTYTVGVEEKFVKVENSYKIDENSSYISNIISMEKILKNEEMRQYQKGNITYNNDLYDQLTFNAYYSPLNNSINLLLGYIYSLTDSLNLGQTDLEENYYKILGCVGTTIGHELSHALDTTGCKYDEYGNYINWWTNEDEYNFNNLTSKVVKYYEQYEQFGDITLSENIADLGGMSIVLQIAESNNATDENYKDIFETYARLWASQFTSIYKEYLFNEDNHSPNKNRTNAVLSTFDKFYEVYEINETDGMYVESENRVSVW